jgi:hypothetical protein
MYEDMIINTNDESRTIDPALLQLDQLQKPHADTCDNCFVSRDYHHHMTAPPVPTVQASEKIIIGSLADHYNRHLEYIRACNKSKQDNIETISVTITVTIESPSTQKSKIMKSRIMRRSRTMTT